MGWMVPNKEDEEAAYNTLRVLMNYPAPEIRLKAAIEMLDRVTKLPMVEREGKKDDGS